MLRSTLFALELALLFVHEMDAIHKREWKMFVILKDMKEETGYWAFTLLHIPLYGAVLLLLFSRYAAIGIYLTDLFLIAHFFIHLLFRRHPENRLNGPLSKSLIGLAGLLAFVHLALYVAGAAYR